MVSNLQKNIQFSDAERAFMQVWIRLAIADIALQVGFSNQSHLRQQFKRVNGITPKQVR